MTKIALRAFGNVGSGEAEKLLEIIKGLYEGFGDPPDLVELLLFDALDLRNAYVAKEARERSVSVNDFGVEFLSVHECWSGSPRIYLSLDVLSSLPEGALMGALEHEVGHTILHGSLESYVFPPELVADYWAAFGSEFAMNLLALVAASVKDFEVTRLWVDRRASRDQLAFIEHLLGSNEAEKALYAIAKAKPDSALLFRASVMKPVACAYPLTMDPEAGPMADRAISKFMGFMEDGEREGILGILGEVASRGLDDTLGNVIAAMDGLRRRFLIA
ncbi:MAG: hypothetical protein QXG32_01040 [Candidatus Bathyarchaeia archaeon]